MAEGAGEEDAGTVQAETGEARVGVDENFAKFTNEVAGYSLTIVGGGMIGMENRTRLTLLVSPAFEFSPPNLKGSTLIPASIALFVFSEIVTATSNSTF